MSQPSGHWLSASLRPVVRRWVTGWGPRMVRVLGHEWTVAALGATLIAVFLNRGALADPTHTLPHDVWDPSLLAYLIAWGGHSLRHDPTGVWDLNAFYPAPYALAYSDTMLGYAPFALVGTGPEAAVLRYNLLFIAAHALVFFGAYCLARQLGLRPGAAVFVGVALGMAPWRLSQTGHLQVLSSGGMFLALAMLARGHGVRWLRRAGSSLGDKRGAVSSVGDKRGAVSSVGDKRGAVSSVGDKRGDREDVPFRPGWALAGWLVATWQVSIGFGLGIPFIYVLLGCLLVGAAVWAARRRPLPPVPLLVATGFGGLVFATVSLLLARPYLRVLELYPYFRRDRAWVELFSPPASGLFTAPEESIPWGEAHAAAREGLFFSGEMSLLPGFALYILASAGLFYSVWPVLVRVCLGFGAAGFAVLSLGTNGPADGELGYLLLLHLPGFDAIRTPGRLIVWATLLLALLGAGAVGALAVAAREAVARHAPAMAVRSGADAPPHPGPPSGAWLALARLAVVVPTLLVFMEGRGTLDHALLPPPPPTLSNVAAPYLVLPTHEVMDMNLMLWSTDRFADMVNGGSGQVPTETRQIRDAVVTFPDQASVELLRRLGVRSVVVFPDRMGGTPLADAATIPIDGLGLTREIRPDAVVFTIDP